jgi:hypothetical protein
MLKTIMLPICIQVLTNAHVNVEYLDTSLFPQQLKLVWHPHNNQGCLQFSSGKQLLIKRLNNRGIYVPYLLFL